MSSAENIKVAVRVRPMNDREKAMGAEYALKMQGQKTTLFVEEGKPKDYVFDYSYWSADTQNGDFADQKKVYDEVGKVILENGFKGYNGCLFAYGQTGSGKSYTMMGFGEEVGIIPRLSTELFERVAEMEGQTKVWVSYVEIYNERVKDLLSHKKDGSDDDLPVFDHPKMGVILQNVIETPVRDFKTLDKLMDFGNKKRATSATNMNAHSSRSHAVTILRIEHKPPDAVSDKDTISSRINLIDLAGSERNDKTGATGNTLKEGSAINQSLTNLGIVIKELAEFGKKHSEGKDPTSLGQHIPFRNSKLTFILKGSLSGNSKTFMLAALSPSASEVEETHSTLRFADSVKSIRTVAQVNRGDGDKNLTALRAELASLRQQLADGPRSSVQEDENTRLKEEMQRREEMMHQMQKDYDEQLKEAKAEMEEREKHLKDRGLALDASSTDPYLLNVSVDPMLTGCLVFPLASQDGSPIQVGSAESANVKISGLGTTAEMCTLLPENGGRVVRLKVLDDACRVIVNGRKIPKGEKGAVLKNNDMLMLGRAFNFRLVVPAEESEIIEKRRTSVGMDPDTVSKLSTLSSSYMDQEIEHSVFGAELLGELADMERHIGQSELHTLREMVMELCPLVDEANEITQDLRPLHMYQFQPSLVNNEESVDEQVRPEDYLLVRVLEKPPGQPKFTSAYLWTVAKFRERVTVLRDLYHRFGNKSFAERAKILKVADYTAGPVDVECDLASDPWKEASLDEIRLLQMESDLRARKELCKENADNKAANESSDDGALGVLMVRIRKKTADIEKKVEGSHHIMQDHFRLLEEIKITLDSFGAAVNRSKKNAS